MKTTDPIEIAERRCRRWIFITGFLFGLMTAFMIFIWLLEAARPAN